MKGNYIERYHAYSNYLLAISTIINNEYDSLEEIVDLVISENDNQQVEFSNSKLTRISQLLRNSWLTEILLNQTKDNEDLLQFSNPWSMVHSYYAIYSMLVAYFEACRNREIKAHQSLLKSIGSEIQYSNNMFPVPWNYYCLEDPRLGIVEIENDSNIIRAELGNALISPRKNPLQHFALFLKTTRQRQVDKKKDDWKRQNRKKRASKNKTDEIVNSLRPTTFFDAIYRLRTRTNYEDIDSFMFANVKKSDSIRFIEAICNIVETTLLIFETLIALKVGRNSFESILREIQNSPITNVAQDSILNRSSIITSRI